MPHLPSLSRAVFGTAALALVPALAPAQAGITVQQKTTFNIAHLSNADLQQTITILGADRSKTVTTGKVKFLIISSDASGTEIVRLDQDQVIKLDDKKKKYEIQGLAEKRAELAKQQQDAEKSATDAREKEDVRYYAVVDQAGPTGQKQLINGFNTEQVLIKLTVMAENTKTKQTTPFLHLIADTWVDPSQREAARVSTAFALAQQHALGLDPTMAKNPYARWLKDMNVEMAKLPGYPIRTQVTFEMEVDSATAAAQQKEEKPAGGIGGALGGMFGRGGAKKEKPAATGSGRPVIFTSTVEVLSIATVPPAASEFEIPAGYTKK